MKDFKKSGLETVKIKANLGLQSLYSTVDAENRKGLF
jgi:hypothetical protein